MKRFKLTLLSASLLGIAGVAAADDGIDVMTQNQYIGADIAPLIGAIGTPGFNDAVVTALEHVAANHTADRLKALAAEIAKRRPHLAGLQEVWQLNCIPAVPELGGYPCNDPSIAGAFGDHLTGTMAGLGNSYKVAAIVQNFTVQSYGPYPGIPFYVGGVPAFLQVMDRDVILARRDVTATKFAYPCTRVSVDGCNYNVVIPLGALGNVERGFVAVDATVDRVKYRVVNTHLEVEAGGGIPGGVQAAQALQLVNTVLGNTPRNRRLIIVGDMNSSPDDPAVDAPTPYMIYAGAGLFDAWLLRPGHAPGLSCCQLEDLSNHNSLLTRRIDLILSREMPHRVKDARLIGDVMSDKTSPHGRGLWPSDHAAVAAELDF